MNAVRLRLSSWPANLEVDGWGLHYHGPVTDELRAAVRTHVADLEAGRLRRWSVGLRGSGGCSIDFPADLDELAVLHAAMERYGGEEITVEPCEAPSGSFGWLRHPDFGGCIDIVTVPERILQPELPGLLEAEGARVA